jgi:hypothetical protein
MLINLGSPPALTRSRGCTRLAQFRCPSGGDDTLAVTALDIAHRQEHVAGKARQQNALFIGLVEVQAIDCARILEGTAGVLEGHAMLAGVELRLCVVPLEFVIARPMPIHRCMSKQQANNLPTLEWQRALLLSRRKPPANQRRR